MSRRRVDPQPTQEQVANSGRRSNRTNRRAPVATITVEKAHGLAVLSNSDRRLLSLVLGVSAAAGILNSAQGNQVV